MAQYTKGIDSRGIFFLAIANGIQCSPVFRTIDQALDYGAFIEKGGRADDFPFELYGEDEEQR